MEFVTNSPIASTLPTSKVKATFDVKGYHVIYYVNSDNTQHSFNISSKDSAIVGFKDTDQRKSANGARDYLLLEIEKISKMYDVAWLTSIHNSLIDLDVTQNAKDNTYGIKVEGFYESSGFKTLDDTKTQLKTVLTEYQQFLRELMYKHLLPLGATVADLRKLSKPQTMKPAVEPIKQVTRVNNNATSNSVSKKIQPVSVAKPASASASTVSQALTPTAANKRPSQEKRAAIKTVCGDCLDSMYEVAEQNEAKTDRASLTAIARNADMANQADKHSCMWSNDNDAECGCMGRHSRG